MDWLHIYAHMHMYPISNIEAVSNVFFSVLCFACSMHIHLSNIYILYTKAPFNI